MFNKSTKKRVALTVFFVTSAAWFYVLITGGVKYWDAGDSIGFTAIWVVASTLLGLAPEILVLTLGVIIWLVTAITLPVRIYFAEKRLLRAKSLLDAGVISSLEYDEEILNYHLLTSKRK
jgi:hypothetical protein